MKYLFLILAICLSLFANGATVKATGYVCATIVALEAVPEPNTIVYTEIGTTAQVVF